eukprot:TRINITY_DN9084_c0_g1_i1.p1 TRINITY_DN9084_c0_g1~~TRINITY_DN9084_c0_g1_i1.p1  ORF type:complete len:184 (+),score=38.51 TRINITY_DN9084_c0_g1_i1:28-579(+)
MNYALLTANASLTGNSDAYEAIIAHLKLLGAQAIENHVASICVYNCAKDYPAQKLYTFEQQGDPAAYITNRDGLFTQVTPAIHVLMDTIGGAFKPERRLKLEGKRCRLGNADIVVHVATSGPIRCLLVEVFGEILTDDYQELERQFESITKVTRMTHIPIKQDRLNFERAQAVMAALPSLRLL